MDKKETRRFFLSRGKPIRFRSENFYVCKHISSHRKGKKYSEDYKDTKNFPIFFTVSLPCSPKSDCSVSVERQKKLKELKFTMKTAVIYARYSSDTQTEQSIEGQLRVCQDYAKNNDILVVGTYVDRAMTGTNDLRPDFQRMIKDSNKRQWDFVLVYKLDRFSRNKYETTIHKHTLKENGVKVLSAMENIPDSPEGIILESLLEGFEQANGHKEYKKLNSELKAAISMYSKNLNKSANFIEN